jgi:hypothetical protein
MIKTRFTILKLAVSLLVLPLLAGIATADQGDYVILTAQYGTAAHHVDVTQRLRELARHDVRFPVKNGLWGVDPDPGVVKVLRIFARGPNGQERMFEYVENSYVDGAMFRGWGGGNWGRVEEWSGNWEGGGPRPGGDAGAFLILSAQYGTAMHHVDVTQRLKELARHDVRFRATNSAWGVDPDRGVVKVLRIYARGPNGRERMFEYREGDWVDGAQFRGWGGGNWGRVEEWSGRWDVER